MAGIVHYEVAERVATITLENPEARNAFDYEMTQTLRRLWAEVKRDEEVRCVVVTGAGERAFCTGWDLRSTAAGESQQLAKRARRDAPFNQITALQNACFTPVVTAVNGLCVGGGLHFVADSDLVLAAEHAQFFDTHVQHGMLAALEPVSLARRIPLEAVLRLALLGGAERMSAAEARRIGLVGEVLPTAELLPRARALAKKIAAHSPTAIARSKRVIWQSLNRGLEAALDDAHEALARHADHPDQLEGPRAFFEKRTPNWAPYRGDADGDDN